MATKQQRTKEWGQFKTWYIRTLTQNNVLQKAEEKEWRKFRSSLPQRVHVPNTQVWDLAEAEIERYLERIQREKEQEFDSSLDDGGYHTSQNTPHQTPQQDQSPQQRPNKGPGKKKKTDYKHQNPVNQILHQHHKDHNHNKPKHQRWLIIIQQKQK